MANDRPPKPPPTPVRMPDITRPSVRNPIPDASHTAPAAAPPVRKPYSAPAPRTVPAVPPPAREVGSKTVLAEMPPRPEPSMRSGRLRPAVADPRGSDATPAVLDSTKPLLFPPDDAPAMRERRAPRRWVWGVLAVPFALVVAVTLRGRQAEKTAEIERAAVDPVAAAEAMRLLKDGDAAMSGARVADARWYYWKAVEQDPGCQPCVLKLQSLEEQMVRDIREGLLAGDSNLQNGRHAEAIAHFERVQMLDPDPRSVNFMNAEAGLRNARRALEARGR